MGVRAPGGAFLENLALYLIVFRMAGPSGLLPRAVAKVIDLVVVAVAVEVLHKSGLFAGILYILISDSLFEGRSLGKRVLGLRVLREDGGPCTVRESMLRNATIALGVLLWRIPLIGWLLFLCLLGLEFVVLLGSDGDRRLGDEIAKTHVVEAAEHAAGKGGSG